MPPSTSTSPSSLLIGGNKPGHREARADRRPRRARVVDLERAAGEVRRHAEEVEPGVLEVETLRTVLDVLRDAPARRERDARERQVDRRPVDDRGADLRRDVVGRVAAATAPATIAPMLAPAVASIVTPRSSSACNDADVRDAARAAAAEHDADAPADEQPRDAVVVARAVDANVVVTIDVRGWRASAGSRAGCSWSGSCSSTSSGAPRRIAPGAARARPRPARNRCEPSRRRGEHARGRPAATHSSVHAPKRRIGDVDHRAVRRLELLAPRGASSGESVRRARRGMSCACTTGTTPTSDSSECAEPRRRARERAGSRRAGTITMLVAGVVVEPVTDRVHQLGDQRARDHAQRLRVGLHDPRRTRRSTGTARGCRGARRSSPIAGCR